jgi:hypothetical protein
MHFIKVAWSTRRCREMIQMASPASFPRAVQTLLQQSLRLRDRYQRGAVCPHGLAVATGRLEARLDRLLDRHFRCRDNQRLAKHLRHEQPHLFTFLRYPGLQATNHFAERAIRLMAMARKSRGGNRTANCPRTQPILASVLRTCWQQGKNAVDQWVKWLRSARPILLEIIPAEPSP